MERNNDFLLCVNKTCQYLLIVDRNDYIPHRGHECITFKQFLYEFEARVTRAAEDG